MVLGVHLLLEPLSYWNSNFSKPKHSKAICGHCKLFRNKACWYFPHLCQLTWIHVEQISYFWVTGVYCRNEGVFQDRKSCDKEQLCCSSFTWILLQVLVKGCFTFSVIHIAAEQLRNSSDNHCESGYFWHVLSGMWSGWRGGESLPETVPGLLIGCKTNVVLSLFLILSFFDNSALAFLFSGMWARTFRHFLPFYHLLEISTKCHKLAIYIFFRCYWSAKMPRVRCSLYMILRTLQ